MAALALSGIAAYFSVFGLSQLFYSAGIGITMLAASLEFAKIVTVSYVYRFWKFIESGLKAFYVFAVVFIMFLTSMGIYGFLTSAYQKSANKIELRDDQVKIAENKKTLFINQLDRVNKSIESAGSRIDLLSGLRIQQENRLDKRTSQLGVKVITSSDEQIKLLNQEITSKMSQTNVINDSIAFYDQKIAELKSSDVNNEIGSYQFISSLTGIPMNKVVNYVALLIIVVFDPLAIALLMAVNKLTMIDKGNSPIKKESSNKFKFFRKRKNDEDEDNEVIETSKKYPVIPKTENEEVKLIADDEVIENEEVELISDDEIETKKNEILLKNCPDGYVENKIDLKSSNIKEGMVVFHNTFGKGVVTKFNEHTGIIFVNFDSGNKELSYEYANLKEVTCDHESEDGVIQNDNIEIEPIQKEIEIEHPIDDVEIELEHPIDNDESDDIIISEKVEDGEKEIIIHKRYINEETPWIVREKDEIIKKS